MASEIQGAPSSPATALVLPPVSLGRYRFELRLLEDVILPPYLGAVLRGGFGVMFKRLVCLQRHLERCEDCVLLFNCTYPAIFQPAPPSDSEVLSLSDHISPPYVLEPPLGDKTQWKAGDSLMFSLTLVGKGVDQLPYFVLAFQALGKGGVGNTRAQGELVHVLALERDKGGETLWQDERLRRDWRTSGRTEIAHLVALADSVNELSLTFFTPTRLKFEKRIVRQAPPFHVVIRTLLRRLSSLSYFHGGQRWDIDYRGWIERAQMVETAAADVQWVDWERYSTRQQQRMNLGGIVGRVTYAGDLGPFLPLLRVGELIHVGKNVVFGHGQYRLAVEPSSQG